MRKLSQIAITQALAVLFLLAILLTGCAKDELLEPLNPTDKASQEVSVKPDGDSDTSCMKGGDDLDTDDGITDDEDDEEDSDGITDDEDDEDDNRRLTNRQ